MWNISQRRKIQHRLFTLKEPLRGPGLSVYQFVHFMLNRRKGNPWGPPKLTLFTHRLLQSWVLSESHSLTPEQWPIYTLLTGRNLKQDQANKWGGGGDPPGTFWFMKKRLFNQFILQIFSITRFWQSSVSISQKLFFIFALSGTP